MKRIITLGHVKDKKDWTEKAALLTSDFSILISIKDIGPHN